MRIALPALLALSLAACASGGGYGADPTANLANPEVIRSEQPNGDVIEEYRVNGRLQVVKVTPARGPVYYLEDRDGDGRPDNGETVSPVLWKLFEWD
ncbi:MULTISPECIES: DUF2782 domain-containing protein [Marilutibacter]|uniref:DUF2782 domain-containing protein n=2 Tax=Marilutibacter TaxID=3382698 RepID=A0A508AIL0_9GAMM|nr:MULTISPECIES: DUF2782 domain-containing protein [Lysobacter]MBB1059873.1 DUF2782 domain-containing protein [Lysobacter spongiae]TQD46975.1 DUF2782 domain-containing protein [Lysobacter aestuarii]